MASCWRYWFCPHFLILAVFQTPTDAYVPVNPAFYCHPEGPPSVLDLQPKDQGSAALVELTGRAPYTPTTYRQTGGARCRLVVIAPPGHELAVHWDHRNVFLPRSPEKLQGLHSCILRLSHTVKASDGTEPQHKEAVRTFDLCNGSKIALSTLFMTNRLTLTWDPPDPSLADKMAAKRLVITAVGITIKLCTNPCSDTEVCNTRHRFLCIEGCISSELACDGYYNCPLAGEDENPADCEAVPLKGLFLRDLGFSEERRQSESRSFIEAILKKAVLKTLNEDKSGKRDVTSTTTSKPGQNKQSGFELTSAVFRDFSDIILKNLLSKTKGVQTTEPRNLTMTTTTKPSWTDDPEDTTLPAALAHYGPWGYLMLGMLICGAVLMLCGLWECCCRSSKHRLPAGGPASTSAPTTVFIISSAGGIGSHRRNSATEQDEAPPTPGPPSYEELDQPPSYSALFPLTKTSDVPSLTIEENIVISGQHM